MTIIISNENRSAALRTARSLASRIARLGYPGLTKSSHAGAYYNDTIAIQTADFTDVVVNVSYWTAGTAQEMLTPAMRERAYVHGTDMSLDEYVTHVNAHQN